MVGSMCLNAGSDYLEANIYSVEILQRACVSAALPTRAACSCATMELRPGE